MDIVGSLILFYCAQVSSCITSLLDLRLIIIESRSKQRFILDQIGNTLVCELRLILRLIVVFAMLISCL
jgi:hypothetical protein